VNTMEYKLLVADRQIVRPGDLLAFIEGENVQGFRHYPEKHIYVMDDKVYADVVGVVGISDKELNVIPLEGTYIPKKDDLVIGMVTSIGITSWVVDIRAPYKAILNGSDVIEGFNPIIHNLRDYIDVGDYILAKILSFYRTRDPLLTIKGKDLGKITEGVIAEVKPSRVPRIIGKKGSMLNTLTSLTGCNIVVAQNGRLWIRCRDDESLNALLEAIKIINERPHSRGLTEEIRVFLMNKLGRGGV
jgi:exosome complex component RRP4